MTLGLSMHCGSLREVVLLQLEILSVSMSLRDGIVTGRQFSPSAKYHKPN